MAPRLQTRLTGQDSIAGGSPPPTVWEALQAVAGGGGAPAAEAVTFAVELSGGTDGNTPGVAEYEGEAGDGDQDPRKGGLNAFEDLEDISIVAAPGASRTDNLGSAVIRQLISHCERMRYRIGVLDSIEGALPAEVRQLRGEIDSKHAALYYPWVIVDDPLSEGEPSELALPPSGFVAGIYARNDSERGVHKAPANEVVRLARSFEVLINKGQQEASSTRRASTASGSSLGSRLSRVGRPHDHVRPASGSTSIVRRYFAFIERVDREGHTVGGVRAERSGAVGQHPAHRGGLPVQRVRLEPSGGTPSRAGVLRAL